MTDGQTLFAVFALLYLIECLRLMPSPAWMAAGAEKSRWGGIRPWSKLHVAGSSPLLLSALPPMKAHVTALPWLFVPEENGLRVRMADGMTTLVGWESLQPSTEEATLHLDAATRVKLTSPALARTWAQRLTEWRQLAPDERRRAFLKHARLSLDTKAAEQAALEAARRSRGVRRMATVLFVWCFGLISAVYHHFGDDVIVLAAGGVLLLLQLVQAWLFLRATRPFKELVPHRRWRALGVAVLPQLAMRAGDAVSFATLKEPPHPLSWKALLEEKEWLAHARQFWREARYVPGWQKDTPLSPEAEALRTFFTHEEVAEADYDPPPAGKLPACPRCGSEFKAGTTVCKDCGGVELRQAAV